MADDMTRLDPVKDMAHDLGKGNIEELRREIARLPAGDKRRALLVAELEKIKSHGAQIGKPVEDKGFEVQLSTGAAAPTPTVPGAFEMKLTTPEPTPRAPTPDAGMDFGGLAAPGERAETPAGAVTGRSQVPGPRRPNTPTPIGGGPEAARVGAETLGSFLGGTVGLRVGGPHGMAVGEGLGAAAGSLVSEVFDPTADPKRTAFTAGAVSYLGGTAAATATGVVRKLIGKPHEAGRALSEIMARSGKVPMAGAALESDFVRNAESIGSSAFGTSEMLKRTREEAADVTADAVRGYVTGFQRYQRSAEVAFQEVDEALMGSRYIPAGAPVNRGPGLWFKGDPRVRDALSDVAEASSRIRGQDGALDVHLRKILDWKNGGPAPLFNFNEVQKIYGSLYDKARALELRAARGEAVEKADHEYVRKLAAEVKKAFDDQVDFVVKDGRVAPEIKDKLLLARASWAHWQEGKELEHMLTRATKDLAGDGEVGFKQLGRELDKVIRRERETGATLLSPNTKESFRQYILAGQAVEESGKQGAYSFIGRVGQLAGLTGMGFGLSGPGVAMFLGPHALAFIFSNETARSLLMRGLRLSPGSAAAARASRELVTMMVNEGVLEPERIHEGGPAGAALRADQAARVVPD